MSDKDTIYRQAAIDELDFSAELLRRTLDDTDVVGAERTKFEWGLGLIESCISDLKDLPSVEPKTGKWIKVYGFATPGGDPVWRCSECGKGVHVYGIEASTYGADIAEHQWVSCPNCGADMRPREEQDERH